MTELVAVDIGGTHARFALARACGGGVTLDGVCTLRTAEHASLQLAWKAFAAHVGRPLPRHAGIAVACPVHDDVLRLTNSSWVIHPSQLAERLGLDGYTLVNDFAAVARAVSIAPANELRHLCGPNEPLPAQGVISVIGPGTGLGVAQLLRRPGGADIIATEGGHIDFAPLDAIEDAMLRTLRARFRRVSVERIVCGPGLMNIYSALAEMEGRAPAFTDDQALWAEALSGGDALASAAFDRFCLSFGSVAGDLALAHGAAAVVVAGGLGQRIAGHLPGSGFHGRFAAKGRFEALMRTLPVKLITTAEPGLVGAAAAHIAAKGP